jgi:hypothetical protein
MPRRGSKAQLVHLLASEDRRVWRDEMDAACAPPVGDDFYARDSHSELKDLAKRLGIKPGKRGRPSKAYTLGPLLFLYDKDLVQRVEETMMRHAVCERG